MAPTGASNHARGERRVEEDLDAVIGDLQGEAARRRAEPGFPLEQEARLGLEMDAQAPQPLPPKLERLARAASQATSDQPPPPSGVVGRLALQALSPQFALLARQVSSLGDLLANALRAVSAQLGQMEQRLDTLEHPDRVAEPARRTSTYSDGWFDDWRPRLSECLPSPSGRVLFVGADAEAAVGILRAEGTDAYGLNPVAERYQDHPDVQPGDLLGHLRAVGDLGLGAVLLGAPGGVVGRAEFAELIRQLARVTDAAVVFSEAPWWWRTRLGPEEADLSAYPPPLAADTWLGGLHQAGFHVTAEHAPSGSSYRVLARRLS
jgi:hypothetical protein